jgi:hypothetical protein
MCLIVYLPFLFLCNVAAFARGDLLFLTNYDSEPVRVGEVLVFKVRSPKCVQR